ncbi:MAG: hypothetical protein IPG86_09595 [Chitinophagaceae bacterium]|nr:hypothetical protein [Chitinophagaceae bacterium]
MTKDISYVEMLLTERWRQKGNKSSKEIPENAGIAVLARTCISITGSTIPTVKLA